MRFEEVMYNDSVWQTWFWIYETIYSVSYATHMRKYTHIPTASKAELVHWIILITDQVVTDHLPQGRASPPGSRICEDCLPGRGGSRQGYFLMGEWLLTKLVAFYVSLLCPIFFPLKFLKTQTWLWVKWQNWPHWSMFASCLHHFCALSRTCAWRDFCNLCGVFCGKLFTGDWSQSTQWPVKNVILYFRITGYYMFEWAWAFLCVRDRLRVALQTHPQCLKCCFQTQRSDVFEGCLFCSIRKSSFRNAVAFFLNLSLLFQCSSFQGKWSFLKTCYPCSKVACFVSMTWAASFFRNQTSLMTC